MLAAHPEVGEALAPLLVDALRSRHGGRVAVAATFVAEHPDRVLRLPSALSLEVFDALATALRTPWPPDRFETAIALMDAAVSVHHPDAPRAVEAACHYPNITVRRRAMRAKQLLGEGTQQCLSPKRAPQPLGQSEEDVYYMQTVHSSPVTLRFATNADVGALTVRLNPELAPLTAARIAALGRSGFFNGIAIHRVVPGFVVQFGDPDGDGFGGSGVPLRCETGPVAFAPLDVGMALAGRDTGSSQLFVTLSRTPHLDGEYTRVGHAQGAWGALVEGDVITDVSVEE